MDSFGSMLRYYGHGDAAPAEHFYDLAVPRLLDLFRCHGVAATFFVVGSEIRGPAGAWLARIRDAGHEVASHGEHHRFMTRLSPSERESEITLAESAIADRIGEAPVGFRAPGYDVDEHVIAILEERGYRYDSSVFPTTLSLAIRLWQTAIRARRRVEHGRMGRLALIAAPRTPYRPHRERLWRIDPQRPIVELPVGTLTHLRLPFHATAVLAWGWPYLEFGIRRLGDGDLVFALHGIDVLGPDRDPIDRRLLMQPGIALGANEKRRRLDRILASFAARYDLMTSRELAAAH